MMRGRYFKMLLSLAVFSVFTRCSTLQTSHIELAQDSYITIGDNEATFHKRGESISLSEEKPVLIESPGKIGVLILPPRGAVANTKLALKSTDQWAGPFVQSRIDKSLNELVGYMNEIQILITQRKLAEAQLAIQFMKKRYPKVDHLKFLEASYLAVAGDRLKAATLLADLLAIYPDNQATRDFLIALTKADSPAKRGTSSENHDEAEDDN